MVEVSPGKMEIGLQTSAYYIDDDRGMGKPA